MSAKRPLGDGFSRAVGDLALRRARRADFEALARLLGHLALEPGDPPASPEAFERLLGRSDRAVLVALRGGGLVGTLDLFVVGNLTHGGAPWAGIENVVVDPRHRRVGVARSLVDGALELAASAGCYKVQLLSDARRPEAHALYEASGFDAPVRGFRRYL